MSILFRYGRGIKWLNLGFVLSTFVAGIFYITKVFLDDKWAIDIGYLVYIIIGLPLSINSVFLFRKTFFKAISFVSLMGNLFLISYYSDYLEVGMFLLGMGVLALFGLFYFSFWIKSSTKINLFLRTLIKAFRTRRRKHLTKEKSGAALFFLMFVIALWILGLGYVLYSYYVENLKDTLESDYRQGFENMEGTKMWIIGQNNLEGSFSRVEILNILGNLGLLGCIFVVVFLARFSYIIGKLTLRMLYTASWRSVILISAMYVTWMCIIVNFLTARVDIGVL